MSSRVQEAANSRGQCSTALPAFLWPFHFFCSSSVMLQEPRSSWYINAPFIAEHPTVPGALHLDQLLSLGGHGWICKQASLAEADSSRDLWAAGQVFRRQFDGYIIPIYQNHSGSFPTRVYELPHWANLWYLAWFPSYGMCFKLKQKTLVTP